MGIQSSIILTVLYLNASIILYMVQPFTGVCKDTIISAYFHNRLVSSSFHILYVLYVMILIVFLDSQYKIYTQEEMYTALAAQRDVYLCTFTFFTGLILSRIMAIVRDSSVKEKMHQENMKQHGNSMSFVNKVVEDKESAEKKSQEMTEENERLKKLVHEHEGLLEELKNNKIAYLKLKEKYEKLRAEQYKDTRKNK